MWFYMKYIVKNQGWRIPLCPCTVACSLHDVTYLNCSIGLKQQSPKNSPNTVYDVLWVWPLRHHQIKYTYFEVNKPERYRVSNNILDHSTNWCYNQHVMFFVFGHQMNSSLKVFNTIVIKTIDIIFMKYYIFKL